MGVVTCTVLLTLYMIGLVVLFGILDGCLCFMVCYVYGLRLVV